MAGDTPTDEAIRAKAYALWDARGRPEGSGEADWEAAKALLMSDPEPPPPPSPPPEQHPPAQPPDVQSPIQVFTDGIFGMTSVAIGAATQMMEGLFGVAPARTGHQAEAAQPPDAGEARGPAERRPQGEAEVERGATDDAEARTPDGRRTG